MSVFGRGAGVDERGALEKRCGLTVTVGSNPTLSAGLVKTKEGHFVRPSFVLRSNC